MPDHVAAHRAGGVADTVKVMGGQDWELWIDALAEAGSTLAWLNLPVKGSAVVPEKLLPIGFMTERYIVPVSGSTRTGLARE